MNEDNAMCAVVYGRLVLHWYIERYGWVLCLIVLMPWLCCADHDHADLDQTGIFWVLTFMPVVSRLMKSLWCCCEPFTPRCPDYVSRFFNRLVSEPDSWYEINDMTCCIYAWMQNSPVKLHFMLCVLSLDEIWRCASAWVRLYGWESKALQSERADISFREAKALL